MMIKLLEEADIMATAKSTEHHKKAAAKAAAYAKKVGLARQKNNCHHACEETPPVEQPHQSACRSAPRQCRPS